MKFSKVLALCIACSLLTGSVTYYIQKQNSDELQRDVIAEMENEILKLKLYNEELNKQLSNLKSTTSENKSDLQSVASDVVSAIKGKDMKRLAKLIHPDKGVRFSPYSFVDTKAHRLMKGPQVEVAMSDTSKYLWGNFDGSGEPISMTFKDYFNRFIYNKDYAVGAKIGYNEFIGKGNTINNILKVYPGASTVEYHLAGTDPKYGGMDWGSLILVFEEKAEGFYLVGIVHGEWTI